MSDSATPWTVAHQAPPSVEFSRQECWTGFPFSSPGDCPENWREITRRITAYQEQKVLEPETGGNTKTVTDTFLEDECWLAVDLKLLRTQSSGRLYTFISFTSKNPTKFLLVKTRKKAPHQIPTCENQEESAHILCRRWKKKRNRLKYNSPKQRPDFKENDFTGILSVEGQWADSAPHSQFLLEIIVQEFWSTF